MLELTPTISTLRLPHPRALAALVASALAAIAVVALLMPGGHPGASERVRGGTPPPSPVPLAAQHHSVCGAGTAQAGGGVGSSATPGRRSALGRVLDAVLRHERVRLHAPAVTGAVVVCGQVVWAGASGVVDLHTKRPVNNNSLFILNSAAKTFVATMVMQEIQDGHLSLDTRLSRFYPWLPNAGQITVRMLLNMTSGLRDYLYNPRIEWMMAHRPRHHWTVDQVLTGLGGGLGSPRFVPGRGFEYSDTNYIALGGILEQVTHRSIERDLQELIARPLGITSMTFAPTSTARAHLAHPYLRQHDGLLTSQWIPGFGVSTSVWGPVFTDGGLAASSRDVARFANALLGGRLLQAKALSQMTHIGTGDYGFGMRGRSFGGRSWLGHRGYFGGFEAENWTDPSRQVTIAVATNLQIAGGAPISTEIWTALARAYDRHSA